MIPLSFQDFSYLTLRSPAGLWAPGSSSSGHFGPRPPRHPPPAFRILRSSDHQKDERSIKKKTWKLLRPTSYMMFYVDIVSPHMANQTSAKEIREDRKAQGGGSFCVMACDWKCRQYNQVSFGKSLYKWRVDGIKILDTARPKEPHTAKSLSKRSSIVIMPKSCWKQPIYRASSTTTALQLSHISFGNT